MPKGVRVMEGGFMGVQTIRGEFSFHFFCFSERGEGRGEGGRGQGVCLLPPSPLFPPSNFLAIEIPFDDDADARVNKNQQKQKPTSCA